MRQKSRPGHEADMRQRSRPGHEARVQTRVWGIHEADKEKRSKPRHWDRDKENMRQKSNHRPRGTCRNRD
jgi:hypothetical protein